MGALKVSLSVGGSNYSSTSAGAILAAGGTSQSASEPTQVKVSVPIDDRYTTGGIVDVITTVGNTISAMVVATREREAFIDAEVVDE